MTTRIPIAPKYETRRLAINIIEDFYRPTVILPPLYFHINPQNIDISYVKKINRYHTFDAYVEEYWGEELDTITCANSTGGFILKDLGLDTVTRSKSKSFFKFQDILDIYRNNGNIYNDKGGVVKKGKVVLFFDPGTYFGYFENFNYTESSDNPYRFLFNFAFKVQKSYTGV